MNNKLTQEFKDELLERIERGLSAPENAVFTSSAIAIPITHHGRRAEAHFIIQFDKDEWVCDPDYKVFKMIESDN